MNFEALILEGLADFNIVQLLATLLGTWFITAAYSCRR